MSNGLSPKDLDEMLASTDDIHRSLDKSRLLITGGTGFFGRWLLESWVDASDRLGLDRTAVVVARDPERFRSLAPHLAAHRSIELIKGDVLGPNPLDGTFDGAIHAATAASLQLTLAAPRVMFDTIVSGTANVLEWLEPSGSIPMLMTSSGAVYGPQDPRVERVDESCPSGPDPLSASAVYAEAKRSAEMLCAIETINGVQCKIARCFAFVGPHLPLDSHFAIGNFIRDGLAGGPIIIEGDGTPKRSYLYASDLAIWLWRIFHDGQGGRAYNVGSDIAYGLKEVAHVVGALCSNAEVTIRGTPVPGALAPRYVPDVRRASQELGLNVSVTIGDAVRRTLEWHRRSSPGVTRGGEHRTIATPKIT